ESPRLANSRTTARPTPPLAPVTATTRPCTSPLLMPTKYPMAVSRNPATHNSTQNQVLARLVSSPTSIATTANGWFSFAAVASAPRPELDIADAVGTGAELVLLVVAPQPVLNIGNKLGSWLTSA